MWSLVGSSVTLQCTVVSGTYLKDVERCAVPIGEDGVQIGGRSVRPDAGQVDLDLAHDALLEVHHPVGLAGVHLNVHKLLRFGR